MIVSEREKESDCERKSDRELLWAIERERERKRENKSKRDIPIHICTLITGAWRNVHIWVIMYECERILRERAR